MIKLCNTSKIKESDFDEIWVITRSANKLPLALANNPKVKVVPDLAPETKLFFQYLEWKKNGNWCYELFKSNYVPEFIREINQNPKSLQLIDELVTKSNTTNIALVCFCTTEYMCHRSIIGGILLNKGANIECNVLYEKYRL